MAVSKMQPEALLELTNFILRQLDAIDEPLSPRAEAPQPLLEMLGVGSAAPSETSAAVSTSSPVFLPLDIRADSSRESHADSVRASEPVEHAVLFSRPGESQTSSGDLSLALKTQCVSWEDNPGASSMKTLCENRESPSTIALNDIEVITESKPGDSSNLEDSSFKVPGGSGATLAGHNLATAQALCPAGQSSAPDSFGLDVDQNAAMYVARNSHIRNDGSDAASFLQDFLDGQINDPVDPGSYGPQTLPVAVDQYPTHPGMPAPLVGERFPVDNLGQAYYMDPQVLAWQNTLFGQDYYARTNLRDLPLSYPEPHLVESLPWVVDQAPSTNMPSMPAVPSLPARMPFGRSHRANNAAAEGSRSTDGGPNRSRRRKSQKATHAYPAQFELRCNLPNCPVPDTVFCSGRDLRRHQATTKAHGDATARPGCPHCSQTFSRPDAVGRHIRAKHPGVA